MRGMMNCGTMRPATLRGVTEVGLTIRRAHHHDAKELSMLAERTFRDAFAPMNTAEDMDLHCRTNYSEALQLQEISNPNRVTLLCEHAGKLVGFGQLRWDKAPSCVVAAVPGEIQRLYVASHCHGTGVGRDIMNACIDEMSSHRSDVVWLGVWERNPRAIAFYRKFGFVEVGEHAFSLGREAQRDIIMARPVTDPTLVPR